MPFTPITNAEIQSGQPVIGPGVGFGKKTKDNFDFFNGQLGSIAANDILNGSFEVEDDAVSGVPANWDRTLFPGGAGVFDTVAPMHGEQGYKFTHPGGGGNGGGTLQSDFFAIGALRPLLLEWMHYVTAAGMHETVEVAYFTGAQVSVSTQTIYDSTSNPTSPTHRLLPLVIPATARFLKVKVIGGDDDVDVAGDSFWDGVRIVFGVLTLAEIGADTVGQSQLNVTDASSFVNIGATSNGSASLAGGRWSWWTGSADGNGAISWGAGNTGAGVIGLRNSDSSAHNFYWDEKYPTASPPYDLGDGEIPLFIYVMLDNTGKIIGISVATNPTWAYHGPTDIMPHFKRNGKKYRRELVIPPELKIRMANPDAEIERLVARGAFKKSATESDYKEFEITQAVKNADMDICPHPFYLDDMTDRTVLLLDPVSDFNHLLAGLHHEGENVRDMLLNGLIEFDNVSLNRTKPDALTVATHKFRNIGG